MTVAILVLVLLAVVFGASGIVFGFFGAYGALMSIVDRSICRDGDWRWMIRLGYASALGLGLGGVFGYSAYQVARVAGMAL